MDTTPPRRLTGIALSTWKRLAEQLLKDQTLTELSVDLLVAYCDAVADYDRDRQLVDKLTPDESVVKLASGALQQHAAITNANRSLERMLKLSEILAIDPYTRARRGVGGHSGGEEPDDLLSRPKPLS